MSKQQNNKLTITRYMRSETALANFGQVVGNDAGAFVSSALLAVANDPALQACTPQSIYISALRAAKLRLHVDPSMGQAYLVPFKDKATLIVGWKGVQELALRTHEYRWINVVPIYEGGEVVEDLSSGWYSLESRGDKAKDRIAWYGAFELRDGFRHSIYITVEEVHDHAQKYSQGYTRKDGAWQKETEKMERKTVLLMLLRHGPMNASDQQVLNQIEADDEDGEEFDAPDISVIDIEPNVEEASNSPAELLAAMGEDSAAEKEEKRAKVTAPAVMFGPEDAKDHAGYFRQVDKLMDHASAEQILKDHKDDAVKAFDYVTQNYG